MTEYSQYDPFDPPAAPSAAQPHAWNEAPRTPSPSVQATMHQMTDRLQTVIDAAERAADAIRFDAEEQARRHLAEAQRKADRMTAERVRLISELTDDLIRHAGQVRDRSEQMVRSLEDAIDSAAGKLGEPAPTEHYALGELSPYEVAPPPSRHETDQARTLPPPLTDPETVVATSAKVTRLSPSSAQVPEEALIHATRLAVAGDDRETIAQALRDRFGLADPDAIVERVLGAR